MNHVYPANQMSRTNYCSVQTLLALESQSVRIGLRESFKQFGFSDFTEVSKMGELFRAMEESSFDLMIISGSLEGTSTVPMISAMRDGRLPHHPFPIVIMLLTEGDAESIGAAINAGPDHLMVLPVAPGPMLKRIEEFAVYRKPFVVTMEYVGPDRRTGPRPGCAPAPHVSVPNPISASIRNTPIGERQSQIGLTRLQLSTIKLRSYMGYFLALENTTNAMFLEGKIEANKLAFFARCLARITVSLPFCSDDLCCTNVDPLTAGEAISDLTADIEAIMHDGPSLDRARQDAFRANCHVVADELSQIISGKAMVANEVWSKQA